MKVAKDTVVTVDYHVHDVKGNLIDPGEQPLVYVHGGIGLFPQLQDRLEGMETGQSFEATLDPMQSFGDYDQNLVSVEERGLFPDGIEVGMMLNRVEEASDGESDEGTRPFRIVDITETTVTVDGNHPLAGISLVFTGTVMAVRPASPEEITTGQPHSSV